MLKAKIIKQTVTFNVAPAKVYAALLDSKLHAKFTGEKAKMSTKVGGKFTAYGDYITGKNLELVPNKKIVQLWRGADWPDGVYSTATFEFSKVAGGTKMIFTQTGVPVDSYEDIKQGWKDFYWERMKELFAA